jgi:hypothetical protein
VPNENEAPDPVEEFANELVAFAKRDLPKMASLPPSTLPPEVVESATRLRVLGWEASRAAIPEDVKRSLAHPKPEESEKDEKSQQLAEQRQRIIVADPVFVAHSILEKEINDAYSEVGELREFSHLAAAEDWASDFLRCADRIRAAKDHLERTEQMALIDPLHRDVRDKLLKDNPGRITRATVEAEICAARGGSTPAPGEVKRVWEIIPHERRERGRPPKSSTTAR